MSITQVPTSLVFAQNAGVSAELAAGTAPGLPTGLPSPLEEAVALDPVVIEKPAQADLSRIFAAGERADAKIGGLLESRHGLKAAAASAAFAATTLMASGAMAFGEGEGEADGISGIYYLALAIGLALVLAREYRVKERLKNFFPLSKPSSLPIGSTYGPPITINGKTYPSFDAVYAEGNAALEKSFAKMKWLRRGLVGVGAILAIGPETWWMIQLATDPQAANDASSAYIAAAAFLTGAAMAGIGGIVTSTKIVNEVGYFTLGYLKKKFLNPPTPNLTNLPVVTTKDIAKWVNALYQSAKVAVLQKKVDRFQNILDAGRTVQDKPSKRVLNFVQLMGADLIRPFIDMAAQSPEGAMIFKMLAQENAVARKWDRTSNLMAGKAIGWDVGDLANPNAAEAMEWLVNHGNTAIIDFVKNWKDGGNRDAIDLWNIYQTLSNQPAPPITLASPAPFDRALVEAAIKADPAFRNPVMTETKPDTKSATGSATSAPTPAATFDFGNFEGQPQAREWLEEMRAMLEVDKARAAAGYPPKAKLHAIFIGPEGVGKDIASTLYSKLLTQLRSQIQFVTRNLNGYKVADSEAKKKFVEKLDDFLKSPSRQNTAVVLLGTEEDINAFFTDYPKYKDSFEHRIRFQELKGNVLAKIVEKMALEEGFKLSTESQEKIRRVLREKKGGSSVARTLLDRAIRHQARRLAEEIKQPNFDRAKLTVLEAADFANGAGPIETTTLEKLDKMTGLSEVKESLRRIVAMLRQNREREGQGLDVTKPSLHALFTGNPGTGKTTVAGIYAEALKEMGYLSTGQLVVTTPSEIVGDVVGAAEKLTREKLDAALGGVLFVDEAHNLVTGNPFGKKALETILTFMENHRDDIVVIFGGYPDQIENLLNADPGLRRRFTERIRFADYSLDELGAILDGMVAVKDYTMEAEARKAALDLLGRQRNAKDFGNAGAVRNLFEAAILKQSQRLEAIREAGEGISREDYQRLIAADFEGASAPDPQAALRELDGFVGLAQVKKQFRELMAMVNFAKARGGDPRENFEPYFLFGGPPGTGKTSVAGVLGKIFKGLGLLPDDKVVAVSATDLMAGYIGQTAEKTRTFVESALGGVLFIDEIGGLAKTVGGFNRDAINQLLTLLEKYRGRLVVVVAGYDKDINAFLRLDDGLPRRFAKRFNFESLTVEEAVTLFDKRMLEARPSLVLSSEARGELPALISNLREAPDWSSGGDIRTLVSEVVQKQALYWTEHPGTDINYVGKEVLQEAIHSLIGKKKNDAGPVSKAALTHEDTPSAAHAMASAEAPPPMDVHQHSVGTEVDIAFAKKVEAAVEELGLQPEEALRQMKGGGPSSALAEAVAKKSGEKPEEVAEKLAKLEKAIAAKPKELGWVCMYCGNSNPDCPYKGREDREKFNSLRSQ